MSGHDKIFHEGGQAVRLPKSCRFPNDQRADEWPSEFLEALGTLTEEIERPQSALIGEQKEPFD